ncbi:phosphoribosyltransferase [Candidatus Cyanaurora vandensis]|uniref:phosphoribosyltransferase n=1 Tax=Candidatus Cyanaurora vandensis TaxID=2714958 RepID=UPI00257A18EE|nr:phosphoribosyltransferase family protein [Candidatus Cyanaurora vandensis]
MASLRILYSAAVIAQTVARLGQELNRDYGAVTEPVVLLVVLKGALVFAADLIRQLHFPCEIACIQASSYRQGTSPDALQVSEMADLTGRTVIVLEDIVDTGLTLQRILSGLSARSVQVCTLLDKPHRRRVAVPIHYRGLVLIEDEFIVGYGLDYAERYRELPDIAVLVPSSLPNEEERSA